MQVIICAYVRMPAGEAAAHKPKLVYLDENNHITHTRNAIPSQAA